MLFFPLINALMDAKPVFICFGADLSNALLHQGFLSFGPDLGKHLNLHLLRIKESKLSGSFNQDLKLRK
jgi:hypothetical protein